jgi:hypothetical protein
MLKPPALRGSTGLHFLQSIAVLEAVWRTAQGLSFLPNRKLVFVVDDDPGMLRGVKRLLREYGYDSVLFASAEAFQNQNDFEKALCVILDINLNDGSSGIELRHRLKSCEHFRAGHLHDWKRQPRRSRGGASIWLPRLSHKAVLGEVAHRATRESIGGIRINRSRRHGEAIGTVYSRTMSFDPIVSTPSL